MPESAFVIVRHGNTFEAAEAPRRIGAATDLPLTAAGHEQGEALGRHFAALDWNFAQVLVSPLARTRQTAQAILRHLPKVSQPQPCEWLREIDHGPDENRPEADVLARIGYDALAAWDEHAVPPPDWHVDAPARIAAWRDLFSTALGEVLIVTSNGAARFGLVAAGLTETGPAGLKLRTGSYGIIRRERDGVLRLADWGAPAVTGNLPVLRAPPFPWADAHRIGLGGDGRDVRRCRVLVRARQRCARRGPVLGRALGAGTSRRRRAQAPRSFGNRCHALPGCGVDPAVSQQALVTQAHR
ncbi:histidine phosphatase family protein [Novosphingobium resinovorum]|uniref:histidine phosphatase family protein n=1 Tax=Novosphingobium resinovorum TaxID=158500 RepID=UPI003D27EF2C